MLSTLRPALVLLGIFTILCGLIYPFAVTGVAQAAFPSQANGSLVLRDNQVVGSRLIGQSFSDPGYFWSRPSATAPFSNNAAASTGSNQGPLSSALKEAVIARIEALRAADPDNTAPIPVDLVTASGSGLDPHVSPAAAYYQVGRVARARELSVEAVRELVKSKVEDRWLGVLGEPRVNVLELNLALDKLGGKQPAPVVVSSGEPPVAP